MVMSAKTGIVQLKISRIMSLAWTGNALKTGKMTRNEKKKKKGLFGEALILTTYHLVVLVIIINEWS